MAPKLPHPSPRRPGFRRGAPLLALAAALLAGVPAQASMERAAEAQARGDLRGAQLELRSAVRANPQGAAARAELARVSLELGDFDTAEREARAALERGFDAVGGTSLLLRSYLALGRTRDLLRDFPVPAEPARAALGARIAAARALAQIALNDRAAARASVEEAVRLDPRAAEPHMAAASLALAENDPAGSEAAVDRALAADPDSAEAILRKATLVYQRGQPAAAAEMLAPLIARQPANANARVLRADALLRLGRDEEARAEVTAALRTQNNNVSAIFLRGLLLARAQDWRAADEIFTRLGPALPQFPDGLLAAATAKRGLGQTGQAQDLAGRHVARFPGDPRGVRLLASMLMEANQTDAAIAALARLSERGGADAEALDMLGRAYLVARRPREAAAALERAVALAPEDAGLRTRLAAARLAAGDITGTAREAEQSLRLTPGQANAREVLAANALARGDLDAAEAELAQIEAGARNSESYGVIAATIRFARGDLAGARQGIEAVLRTHPESIGARLVMARVALAGGDLEGAERLWGEVVRRQPTNPEALGRLAALARPGSPRATTARALLEAAQAAAPHTNLPALTLATALANGGDLAGAARVLESDALRALGRSATPAMLRAQVYAGLERWAEAETEARSALAEEPDNVQARRQLALLMLRADRAQDALALLADGRRRRPADPVLQQTLIGVLNQSQGVEAALAQADRIAQDPTTHPAGRSLRGDFLLSLQRPADAAAAYAAANAQEPTAALSLREAGAWRVAGDQARASAVLEALLRREPENLEALDMMAQIDLALGRYQQAEQRLTVLANRAPGNAAVLNNLAWTLARSDDAATLARARGLAERAYLLLPSAESSDTLGWILARTDQTARALPLLRQAAEATNATQRPDRGIVYRYAYALRAAGQREEALRVLEPAVAAGGAFAERAEAERLLAELRAGR